MAEACTEQPGTPSNVSQAAEKITSSGSTNSIEFVTVIVPLTRLPESVLKSANPHIALPMESPQLQSPDFPDSTSIPSYFEGLSPQSQQAGPSVTETGNINQTNDLSYPETSTPEAQTQVVSTATGIEQGEFQSAAPVPASSKRLGDSSHSTNTSIHKDIHLAPAQTAPHQTKAPVQPLLHTIFPSQPSRSSKRQYKRPLCVFCGKVFAHYDILFRDHLRSHIQEDCFECAHCGKRFSKEQSYNVHLRVFCRVRNKEKCHSCPVCQKSFRTKSNLQEHIKIHSSQRKIYRCTRCPATFESRQGLRFHEKAKHEKRRKKCEECGTILASEASLRQHMKRHRNIKAHSCLFCNAAFVTNNELFVHLRHHHTREGDGRVMPHSCTFCRKKFASEKLLYDQLCCHIHEKWHSCSYCGNQFYSKRAALAHIGRYHKETV